jgi:hypothetical protein
MRWLRSRYAHVPLAALSVVVLAGIIVGLLPERLGGPWPPWWPLSRPSPSVMAIPAEPDGAAGAQAPNSGPATLPEGAVLAVPRPPLVAQYALESGPLPSPQAADRIEAELNRLGHVTVRFLREDTTRLFVVTAGGFASLEEARQAARELGRGQVVEDGAAPEIVLGRHASLAEAVAAARPVRARGLEVRVTEAVASTALYHIRYGQFARHADAQAYREELERRGIRSRVVKVR